MNYSDSEKAVIITKYRRGIPIQKLSTEYGISERTIYRWAKHYPAADDEQFLTSLDKGIQPIVKCDE